MDESQKNGQEGQPDQAQQNAAQEQPKEGEAGAGTVEEKVEPQLPDLTTQRLKDMQQDLRTKMRLQQEPVAELRAVLEAIEAVVTDQARVFEGKPDAEEHFFKGFLSTVLKALTLQIKSSLTNEEFRLMVGRFPPLLARLLFNNLDKLDAHDSLASVFDHKSRLYQNHYQSAENAILTQSRAAREHLSEEERSWRESLQEGSQIEAIKVDPALQCKCWATCIVQSVTENKVRVKFIEESKTCDRDVELWGTELAPCGERSKADDDFRANLAIGQRVDCYDGTRDWYAAIILAREVREFQGEQIKQVQIAFRVPHPDGDKTDKAGNKYFGWEEEYDEWMPERSARIVAYQTHTTDALERQTTAAQNANPSAAKASDDVKVPQVDDSMDAMVDQIEGQRIFAVQRKQCRSDLLIDFLNTFGRLGGFESLFKRIHDFEESQKHDDELKYLAAVVENLAKCGCVLHQSVATEYFEQLESVALKKILGATNRQLRNTNKETTDEIVENLYKEILPRLASRDAVGLACDKQLAILDIGLLFLAQDFLGRRVDGVKLIGDVSAACLRAIQQPPSTSVVSATQAENYERKLRMADQAVEKLMNEGTALRELFTKERTHTQLVQRTEQLLRLLMTKGQLNAEARQLVWQAGQINDGDMKTDLYKVLIGAAPDMLPEDREFFLEKALSIPRNEVIDREVEMVTQICTALRGRTDCEEIAMKGIEYMWEMVLESGDQLPVQVVNRAQMGLSEILKGRSMEVKVEYADRLAQRARDGRQGFLVVKVFARLLKIAFEGSTGHPEIENLSDMVEHLEKKHQLYDAIFRNLVDYMANVAEQLASGREDLKSDPHAKVIHGLYPHSDQITQRLDFIKFYAQSSTAVSISSENLNVLWEELALKSPIDQDRKQIYEWLREVCDHFLSEQQKHGLDESKSGQSLVTLRDLMAFYKEKMLRSDEEDVYKDLSLEGFHCIQSFFVLLNGISGKLIRITEDYGRYKGKHLVEQKSDSKGTAKEGVTGSEATPSAIPAAATAIEYNAGTGTLTSYSSTGGAGYAAYSWSKATTSTSTGTTTYGPHKPGVTTGSGPDGAKEKSDVDPEDLAIQVLVPPNELEGYLIIWRLATESRGKQIIDAAAKLLVQMHHSVDTSLEGRVAEFDDMYIAQCFGIANRQKPVIRARTEEEKAAIQAKIAALPGSASQIQVLAARPVHERRIIRSLFLLKQLIRASEKGGTYDLRPHESLSSKGAQLGALHIQNNVTHGDAYRQRIEISIGDQATLWDLKKRIGVELASTTLDGGKTYALHPGPDGRPTPPVHPAAIRLFQMSSTSDVKDPNNGVTLKELRFKSSEHLGAFRKNAYLRRRGLIVVDNEETGEAELSQAAARAVEEVFEQYSVCNEKTGGVRMMTKELCVAFTEKVTDNRSSVDDRRVTELMDQYCIDKNAEEKLVAVDGLKRFCINACLAGKEDSLRGNFRRLGYAQDLRRLPRDGEPENIEQLRASKEDMPRYKITLNEHYFDSLLELLEFDPEVATRARDAIAALATQPVLYSIVSKLEFAPAPGGNTGEADEPGTPSRFDWSSIFDSDNVYKMQYTLEIVAAILVGYAEEEKAPAVIVTDMAAWVKRFLELRGLQELQRQLSAALEKVGSEKKSNDKKLADQLLQLIKMFVMTAMGPEEEGAAEPEKAAQEQVAAEPTQAPAVADSTPAQIDSSKAEAPASGGYQTPTKKKVPIQRTTQVNDAGAPEVTVETLFGDDFAGAGDEEELKKMEEKIKEARAADDAKSADSLRYLRQVMRIDGISSQVLQLVDARGIQQQMVKLVDLLLDSGTDLQREDRLLVDSALGLWAQLVKGAAAQGLKPEIDRRFVLRGLLEAEGGTVRESFGSHFKDLAKESLQVAEQVFDVLFDQFKSLEQLGELKNKRGRRTEEFLALLAALVPIVCANKPGMLLEILQTAIENSKLHYSTERSGEHYIDSTRVGLFDIMAVVLPLVKKDDEQRRQALAIAEQTGLIEHIHRDCLFYYGGNQEIVQDKAGEGEAAAEDAHEAGKRCYTAAARKAAYAVLNEYQGCLEPKEMAEYLQNYIAPLLKDVARPKKWKHQPSAKGRVHGHCGLVNLGCICYMISMLQQFFLVPQFRYQLLKAEDDTPENLAEYKGDLIDDNLLRQLRRLFGYLELSARRAYDPKPLCFSFKEFDGTPTKIGEQKDSQEFLNIFFDRLETQLKPTSQRHLLKDVFAGNQCTQLICSSCGKVKNRIELFYNLSLQVKGSAGIYDSLGQLAKGQTIEDFNCDFCNQRTNVVRRQLLADTPNTLIVHLQRIVFSFDTLQNDKVNARFEFPTLLDLKDYSFKARMTQEGHDVNDFKAEEDVDLAKLMEIDDDEYIYRLVGVNVHVGTADHGHYYSLIDLRRGAAEPDPTIKDEQGNAKLAEWTDVSRDPWKVFNDCTVRHFNFDKELKAEAFGESAGDPDAGDRKSDALTDAEFASFLATGSKTYGKSAYMLVYERKSKKSLHEVFVVDGQEETKLIEFRSVPKFVPEWIQKEVEEDNKQFHIDAQMFHDDFFGHAKAFFKWITSELVTSSHKYQYEYYKYISQMKGVALQVGGKVLFDMQCYYDHNVLLNDFGSSFETLLLFCDSAFNLESGEKSLIAGFVNQYLLADDCQHFFKIMFSCTSIVSRKYAGLVAGKAVSRLIRLYHDCKPELRESVEGIKEVKAAYSKVIDLAMVALMDKECQRSASRLESFFKFLQVIATSSVSAAQHFLERSDAIADLIDFMLGNASPRVANSAEKRVAMGGTTPPPFQPLFSVVSFLIRMTHTSRMDLDQRLPTHIDIKLEGAFEAHKSYFLQDEAGVMLTATDWLDKVIYDPKYTDEQNSEFCKAMAHLCYKDLAFSKQLISKLLKAIGFAADDGLKALLQIVDEVALVKDEFQVQRLEYLFGFGFLMHAKDDNGNMVYGRQLQEVRTSLDEVYLVASSLDARASTDGLIHLLWGYHKRFENRALACLQHLLTIAVADEAVAHFLSQLPAYDYSMARFTDFIRPYLAERHADNEKYQAATGYQDKQDHLIKVTSILEQYELFLEKQKKDAGVPEGEQEYISCPQQPYIVLQTGGQESERVVYETVVDDVVEVRVTQVGAFWITSKPLGKGKGNLSLPKPEEKAKDAGAAAEPKKEEPKPSDEITDPAVKAQFDSMKDSLGMTDEKAEATGDSTKPPEAQIELKEPQDAVMVVDAVADSDPVVSKAVPTVQELYPDCQFCEDLLFRVTLTNKVETNLKVEVEFSTADENTPVNLRYPSGSVLDFLKPAQTGTLMTLAKTNPIGDPVNIENLQIKVTQSTYADNDFQMNSFASQSDIPSSIKASTSAAAVSKNIKDQRRNGILGESKPNQKTGDMGVGDDSVIDYGAIQEKYLKELEQIQEMGFTDDDQTLKLLEQTNGNVQSTLEQLFMM